MSNWISVEDRFPENNQRLLVVEYGEVFPAYFEAARESWIGHIPNRFRLYGTDGHFDNVTHWMPLPEPPQEETR